MAIGNTKFYRKADNGGISYTNLPETGNDGGMGLGGWSDLGGKQQYIDSLKQDIEGQKQTLASLTPSGDGRYVILDKREDGSTRGVSPYFGQDPNSVIKALQSKLEEAQAGQGVFADNYNNGAQVINGNYTEKGALDAEAQHQANVKAGTEKIAQTVNGVNFYQPIDAAPFVQGSQGQPTGQQTLGISDLGNKFASAGSPDSGTYQTSYTPASSGSSSSLPPGVNLSPGMTGNNVKQLQDYLVANGYMTQAQVNTGYGTYGPQTTAAVAKLQAANGVDNSSGVGYWGPKTQASIQSGGNTTSGNNSGTGPTSGSTGTDFPTTGDPKLDAIFGSLKGYLTNVLASGYQVNNSLQITPDLVSKFLADAHTQIDPKYQQILTNEIGNINASLKNLGTNYQNQQGQTIQDFQTNLANSREDASDKGTVFSGQRGLNEQNAVNTTNRSLNALDNSFATNMGNTLRTGAGKVGMGLAGLNGSTSDFVTPQLNGASVSNEGARGSSSTGGALDYGFNAGNYKYGEIPGNYASDLVDQSNNFLSNYQKSGANNGRTFQNLNGTPTLY